MKYLYLLQQSLVWLITIYWAYQIIVSFCSLIKLKDKINIITETNDSKANVDGDGERELVEGFNEIIVTVYAENGDAREYKLKITREELNPIEVVINGKKYRVVNRSCIL